MKERPKKMRIPPDRNLVTRGVYTEIRYAWSEEMNTIIPMWVDLPLPPVTPLDHDPAKRMPNGIKSFRSKECFLNSEEALFDYMEAKAGRDEPHMASVLIREPNESNASYYEMMVQIVMTDTHSYVQLEIPKEVSKLYYKRYSNKFIKIVYEPSLDALSFAARNRKGDIVRIIVGNRDLDTFCLL